MRDLLFKNLTSADRKRRVISSCEITDSQGVRSTIRRHFICVVKEVKDKDLHKPLTHLYVVKERSTKEKVEKFFCRLKGSVYATTAGRLFCITFMHSLRIHLTAIPASLMQYNEDSSL